MDSFSNLVAFLSLRNIPSAIVCDISESRYFSAYGVPKSIISDNAKVFGSKEIYDSCFRWGLREIILHPTTP